MAAPKHFKVADFDDEPGEMGHFCVATINWSKPRKWVANEPAPIVREDPGQALYVIIREHGLQTHKQRISYVGMSTNLHARFVNHPKAHELRDKGGPTLLSIGTVVYSGPHSNWAREYSDAALNQIEHILIWSLWPTLENDRKQYSIPLLSGKNIADGKPWLIRRAGHSFSGAMPREIAYPWMIIKHGRDRSLNN